ncbi:MAG: LytTR family DNA-binding domain-containing protein [Bacteroidota bacterium]|nr:LytTR family DNA-binding domain-containing protein [Bacteroidota bacterium]MDP4254960.1 LytTR family DNA-binding domain-containing protein [Bacteroidota bacterium]MDP4258071.1 LytTR family DNA-binding domain-containing protein [Bacteroidota bacterium]
MSFIFVRVQNRYHRIDLNDVVYIESARNYCKIVCRAGGTTMALTTMTRLVELLPGGQFLRIQRSYIVALDKIVSFDKRTVAVGDKQLPIGESYLHTLMQHLLIVDISQPKAR